MVEQKLPTPVSMTGLGATHSLLTAQALAPSSAEETALSTHSRIHDIRELGPEYETKPRAQLIREICLSVQPLQINVGGVEPFRGEIELVFDSGELTTKVQIESPENPILDPSGHIDAVSLQLV